VIVSVSCPQIFKKELIELPARGCLNVHGASLPQYRGVMPSFWMLANGERQAGVSVYFVKRGDRRRLPLRTAELRDRVGGYARSVPPALEAHRSRAPDRRSAPARKGNALADAPRPQPRVVLLVARPRVRPALSRSRPPALVKRDGARSVQ
jgi:hypothetical protein